MGLGSSGGGDGGVYPHPPPIRTMWESRSVGTGMGGTSSRARRFRPTQCVRNCESLSDIAHHLGFSPPDRGFRPSGEGCRPSGSALGHPCLRAFAHLGTQNIQPKGLQSCMSRHASAPNPTDSCRQRYAHVRRGRERFSKNSDTQGTSPEGAS